MGDLPDNGYIMNRLSTRRKMIKISDRKCPICKASECELIHKQRFVLPEGHPQAAGYDVVCCTRCGFVFADTTVTQQDYDVFYAKFSKYQDNVTSTGGVALGMPND
jgi:C4-type Zn-finger protein